MKVDATEEFDRAYQGTRCATYREKTTETREYKFPEWQLRYFCRQKDMCACAEIDRRERHQRGVAVPRDVAEERMRTGAQTYHVSLSQEYQRIKNLPPKKLKDLAREYSDERKAHPKLTNAVILQIAKDHLAYKNRPRKRWKRRKVKR